MTHAIDTTPANVGQTTAIVDHESWTCPAIFIGGDAEDRAAAFLIHQTEYARDRDEFPSDEEWIDICQSEGWTFVACCGSEANWEQ